jgi:hypothetical protein
MLYLRARYYDTTVGRFTTPDPMAALPRPQPAVSPYVYANNDPFNQTDPLGLFSLAGLPQQGSAGIIAVLSVIGWEATGREGRLACLRFCSRRRSLRWAGQAPGPLVVRST